MEDPKTCRSLSLHIEMAFSGLIQNYPIFHEFNDNELFTSSEVINFILIVGFYLIFHKFLEFVYQAARARGPTPGPLSSIDRDVLEKIPQSVLLEEAKNVRDLLEKATELLNARIKELNEIS
jgi:hypothetical protein